MAGKHGKEPMCYDEFAVDVLNNTGFAAAPIVANPRALNK